MVMVSLILPLWMLSAGCSHPRAADVNEIADAFDTAVADVSWPGFTPAEVPLVLYDDANTYLLRHPAPPARFERMRGADGVWVADTLFAELRANTDAEFAGVRSAVAAIPSVAPDAVETAALLMHEAFHVYQSTAHPAWSANEVDLFTYPVRPANLLQLRRLEGGALRRAVTAPDSVRQLCWAQAFLKARKARFDRLPSAAVGYERATELREGLARYVQGWVTGSTPALPADGFRPEDVRERAYATGHALAVLLDRLAPDWKRTLTEADDPLPLEALLEGAIGDMSVRRCGASPDEIARARSVARSDSADLARRDQRVRAAFDAAPGWSVEIVAGAEPLNPQRFDPLNVRVLDDRHVLHTRWIVVGNETITAEALDRNAMTRGLPGHPLFAGIDRFRVTGLREPEVVESGDTLRVTGDGLTVTAVGAQVERDGQTIRILARH